LFTNQIYISQIILAKNESYDITEPFARAYVCFHNFNFRTSWPNFKEICENITPLEKTSQDSNLFKCL